MWFVAFKQLLMFYRIKDCRLGGEERGLKREKKREVRLYSVCRGGNYDDVILYCVMFR